MAAPRPHASAQRRHGQTALARTVMLGLALAAGAAQSATLSLGNLPGSNATGNGSLSVIADYLSGPSPIVNQVAVEFAYTGPADGVLQKIVLPISLMQGRPLAEMSFSDVTGGYLVARALFGPYMYPTPAAWTSSLYTLDRADPSTCTFAPCFNPSATNLVPGHSYRIELAAIPGPVSEWAWKLNSSGDNGGYLLNGASTAGAAPAWRVEVEVSAVPEPASGAALLAGLLAVAALRRRATRA